MSVPAAESARETHRVGTELARLVASVAIGLAAAFLFVDAGSLPDSRWEPLGAGSFPRLVFALLVLLAVLDATSIVRRLRAGPPLDRGALAALPRRWIVERHLVIAIFVAFGVYLALVGRLGFSVATLGFMLVAGLSLAPRTPRAWFVVVTLALAFSFGLNALFANVFDVFLPRARG